LPRFPGERWLATLRRSVAAATLLRSVANQQRKDCIGPHIRQGFLGCPPCSLLFSVSDRRLSSLRSSCRMVSNFCYTVPPLAAPALPNGPTPAAPPPNPPNAAPPRPTPPNTGPPRAPRAGVPALLLRRATISAGSIENTSAGSPSL